MKKYKMARDAKLPIELAKKYIEKDRPNLARQKKLMRYYLGKNDILRRTFADATKPNNKIAHPFGYYISNITTGYFMGNNCGYSTEDDAQLAELTAITDYNDDSKENQALALDMSIYGVAYEILYLDADAQIRYKKLEAEGCIPIYTADLEEELLYFIRYYDEVDIATERTIHWVEIYDSFSCRTYKDDGVGYQPISDIPHNFGLVPICVYYNEDEAIGDFERVIPLIDAYDIAEADTLNDQDYFSDAYLALYGLEGTESDDIANMKEHRVMLLPVDAKAEFLTKAVNENYDENQKSRLEQNIHKFSMTPCMTDENFAANASGVAMKYKLLGLEDKCGTKESFFKFGLQRRFELICAILNLYGNAYDYRAIEITFVRNLPSDLNELADIANKLAGLYSDETLMSLIPIDVDFQEEQERKKAEAENALTLYDFGLNEAEGEEDDEEE